MLLHGGGDTIKTSFGRILPELERDRQIIAFEQSADDTAALLNHLQVEKADLFGFSNGGTIALQVAIGAFLDAPVPK